ncbi:MAG: response regulator [Oleispira sp.]|nr:response regulator [Oleispira sp.]MBL4882581.1 response regulator [Oleispira sp.]
MSDLILIVDDDESVYSNIQAYLEDEGYQVCIAESGEQGLICLKTLRPQFAIVDMRLPGMAGDQFIRQAQRLQAGLQFLIHTGSVEYQLPDFLQGHPQVRQSIFYKPLLNMESLVAEMCS